MMLLLSLGILTGAIALGVWGAAIRQPLPYLWSLTLVIAVISYNGDGAWFYLEIGALAITAFLIVMEARSASFAILRHMRLEVALMSAGVVALALAQRVWKPADPTAFVRLLWLAGGSFAL